MKESIKAFAHIGTKTFLKWVLIAIGGLLFSIICAGIILFKYSSLTGGGHGVVAFITNLATQKPTGLLLLLGTPFFTVLYFLVANKTALQTAIHLLWKSKALDFIQPKMTSLFTTISKNQPGWLEGVSNETLLRIKLLNANSLDKDSSFLKRKVLGYGLKKIKLNEIDFKHGNKNLPEAISGKIIHLISETTEPSYFLFWIVFGIQSLLLFYTLAF